MVAINLDGFLVSLVRTLAKIPSCFFSISMCILLAEIKAISIPEKKAEKTREKIIIRISGSTIGSDYPFDVVQIFYDSFYEKETYLWI
jgi:hypothetical protein